MKDDKHLRMGILGFLISLVLIIGNTNSVVLAADKPDEEVVSEKQLSKYSEVDSPCAFLHTDSTLEMEGNAQFQIQTSDEVQTCSSVQVVLMIDQSASMRMRNDPTGLRFYGPLNMVDILGKNYLLAKQSGSSMNIPLKIDLAIIHIGKEGQNDYNMPLTRIAPTTEEAWEDQKGEIFSYINPNDLEGGYLDGTDFVYAFEEAERMLENAPQEEGCPQRIVVILTDGNPDTKGYPLKGKELDVHMSQVQAIVERSFSGSNDKVYVTAFDSQDLNWETGGPYWKVIANDSKEETPSRVEIVNSRPEIGLRLADIIQTNIGESTVEVEPGPIVVPPYVQMLRLTFYPPDPSDFMELRDPNDNVVAPSRTDLQVTISGEGTAIQVLELKDPEPGTYQVSTSANRDDVLITMQPIFVRTDVKQPTANLLQFSADQLQLDLVDSDGNKLPVYADERYQLKINACFVDEKGSEYPVSLVPSKNDSSLTGSFTPVGSGIMDLYVQAVALDDEGRKWEILKGNAGTFTIDPVTVVTQNAIGEGGCEPFQYQPFTIPLSFVNQSTNEPVILSLPVTWNVQATASDGSSIKNIIVKENTKDPGTYVLEATSDKVGEVNIDLSASAPDPVDGKLYEFYREVIPVGVNDGQRIGVALQTFEPMASDASQILPSLVTKYPGNVKDRIAVTGRSMYFGKKLIKITAQLTDTEANMLISEERQIPGLRLQNVATNEIIETAQWQYVGEGKYLSSFKAPSLGVYRILMTSNPAECGILTAVDSQAGYLVLVPNLGEQILSIILLIAILIGLYVLFTYLLNRFVNPLKGTMGILNSEGRVRGWYHGIDGLEGKGLWAFKMPNPADVGGVKKIKLKSWPKKKNQVTIMITMYKDFQTLKVVKKKYECDLNNWQDIHLLNECRLIWKEDRDEIMHLT